MSAPALLQPHTKSLWEIGAEVRTEHAAVRSALSESLQHARRAGDLLCAARARLGRGDWQSWLREHALLPDRTARLYMQIAKNWDRVQGTSSVREAVAALRKPKTLPELAEAATPVAATSKADRVMNRLRAALRAYAQLRASQTQADREQEGCDPLMVMEVFVGVEAPSRGDRNPRRFRELVKDNPIIETANPKCDVLIRLSIVDDDASSNYKVQKLPRVKV